ncbi:MAG TPA: 50S ribosomal protein L22 [Acidimicrobiia bacterium]|jgi:large subunit ribosomal protein L22
MPETKATLRYLRTSAYKVREVLSLIRDLPVEEARHVLQFCERSVARDVLKVLNSAVANAEHTLDLPADELYVSVAFADEGPTIKRWRPRARGRATRIRKRTSHMTIVVARFSDDQLQARRRREAAQPGARRRGVLPRRRRGEGKAAPAKAAAPEAAPTVEEEAPEPEEVSLSEAEPGAPDDAEQEAVALEAEASPPEPQESADKAARYATLGREEEEEAAEEDTGAEAVAESEEEGSS